MILSKTWKANTNTLPNMPLLPPSINDKCSTHLSSAGHKLLSTFQSKRTHASLNNNDCTSLINFISREKTLTEDIKASVHLELSTCSLSHFAPHMGLGHEPMSP